MTEIRKTEKSTKILEAARNAWNAGADLRARRRRAKRFTYGDQWSDITRDRWGDVLTEGQLATKQGRTPMTNNLIRRLVKCVVGHFRMKLREEKRNDATAAVSDANSLDEIDSRLLEEFLISGCAIQQVVAERRSHGNGVWVDNISPEKFFVNTTTDPRGWDIELIGRLHDMSFPEVMMRFGQGDPHRIAELRRIFLEQAQTIGNDGFLGRYKEDNFSHSSDSRCRVIEVWTLEATETLRCHDRQNGKFAILPTSELTNIEVENNRRATENIPGIDIRSEFTTGWHCRWLSPDGSLLGEQNSPNSDGSHPFIVKLYPLTDGEVHSLVEDVIDQQIYVNRLITTINHMMKCSAKGALLFPIGCEVEPGSLTKIANMWASPDAVIPYNPIKEGEPHQVGGNVTDIGARELLTLEIQMFEDVSGVSNALMGKSTSGGNAGYERYESEVRNALVSITDLLETFNHFRDNRDKLILKTSK